MALALACLATPAAAQVGGPPIAPDQVLRAQPMPQTTVPPPAASPSPSVSPPPLVRGRGGEPPSGRSAPGDRVRDCEHQAAVEGVPRSGRASYIHSCLQGN